MSRTYLVVCLFLVKLVKTDRIQEAFEQGLIKKVGFVDCGNGEGIGVAVSPCKAEPCIFKKGTTATNTIRFRVNQDTATATVAVSVNFKGIDMWYDGIETDICKVTSCPLRKGEIRTATWDIPAHFWLPPILAPMTWNATGDEGNLFCGTAIVGLEEE
ncbi:Mite group 2 allergen Lep d 2 [Halotydeus destructor]|nr:Mite group 2 allergen Lep d 2 [Halotydeus destructor]